MAQVLKYSFFGVSLLRYILTTLFLLSAILVVKVVTRRLVVYLNNLAQKKLSLFHSSLAEFFSKVFLPFSIFFIFYSGLKSFNFSARISKVFDQIFLGIGLFFLVRLAILTMGYGFKLYLKKRATDTNLTKTLQGLGIVIKIVLWTLALVFFLDNLGFKISAVITGLGIGGVAIALAAQAILKDLFSYFCIIFDQPFRIGDFIVVGDFMGTIEHIGIKTTRLRSLGGELLVIANSDLTDSRLRNFQLMHRRRVVFKIGVVYATPLEVLKEIPQIIEGIIKKIKDAVFERAHFSNFGDFSLVFEVVYYVLGSDYQKYMDIQQEINFAIKEEFEKRKIEFAYPTQTVLLQKVQE